jgi:hypothetical protein
MIRIGAEAPSVPPKMRLKVRAGRRSYSPSSSFEW